MKTTRNNILKKNELSTLIHRFKKSRVIEEMERNLRQGKSSELLINSIDDNAFIKSAIIKSDTLKEIGLSIQKSGLTNPLVVRKKKDHYEIIFGRKRLLACKKFNIIKAPVVIIDVSDQEMLFMLLADNREQRDANIVETSLILKELITKFNFSQKTLADLAHQSRSQITNILRILTLPKHIIDDISLGKLSYGHAKAIASLPETEIESLVNKIYKDNLSVRETETIVKNYHKKPEERKLAYEVIKEDKQVTIKFINNKDKERFLNLIKTIN